MNEFAKVLTSALLLLIGSLFQTQAAEQAWHRSDTLFGKAKYGESFDRYEHVNTEAPKGGRLNSSARGGFDTFNPFIPRGRAAAGINYQGGLLYDSLFEQALDQPSASYGLVADAFRKADDFSWAVYRLDAKAKWHDGQPITAEDVIWSMETLKEIDPRWSGYFKNVSSVTKVAEREIRFEFDVKGNRELPHIIGDLPVLPKHWWTGNDAEGNARNIRNPITEPPLGSGPYRIKSFDLGKSIIWERVEDYWAINHPTRVGRYNFDELHYTYFLDTTAIWEAFKKGGIEDIRLENQSRRWATEYTFPAFTRREVVRNIYPETGPQFFQAYYFNTRLEKFSDPRVRQAIGLVFDFETMNKNLFFDLYQRTDSTFEGGELESRGIPEGRELEILSAFRDQLPEALFTTPFELPVLGSNAAVRKAQRKAIRLFKEAGYQFKGGQMVGPDGKPFTIEFLGHSPTDERIANPFIENLSKIGIAARLRVVDTAQYQARLDEFDYEVMSTVTAQSLSPGNEQREYWSSEAAERQGSRNYAGIRNPVIDDLVEKIIVARDRDDLLAHSHALDRVLKWSYYTIPQWHNPARWVAHWNHITIPERQPGYIGIDLWSAWVDPDVTNSATGN